MKMSDENVKLLKEDIYDDLRIDLAAAARKIAEWGMHEGVNNHLSLRIGKDFLVNPLGVSFDEIYAGDFVTLPIDNTKITLNSGFKRVEKTACVIHGIIHQQIEGANCIIHTHMKYATALSCLKNMALPMVNQNAIRFYNQIAYDKSYKGLAKDAKEGQRLVKIMKDKKILLMANHGVIITGQTIAEALHNIYYFEKACENYLLALSTGLPLKNVPLRIVKKAAQQMAEDTSYPRYLLRSAKSSLERNDSDYMESLYF